ncbi:MAG: NAD+ synthase [Actinomycetota bacterium]|nr:NAD+ synthase [Actinomycetota bacterium]
MQVLRVAACQINTVVGDLVGNTERILRQLRHVETVGCDVAVFPELAITGYPPEDLLLKPGFVADNRRALEAVAERTRRCVAVVGFVDADHDLHNAAAVCARGEIVGVYRKRHLPNYSVFDEQRYFRPGVEDLTLFVVAGARVGVSICEDAWNPAGPIAAASAGGAQVVVNLNASPYHAGRQRERERMLATRAVDAGCAIVSVNQVGGQDELVFDGASLVLDDTGEVVARSPQFEEHILVADLELPAPFRSRLLDPRGRPAVVALPALEVTDAGTHADRQRPPLDPPVTPLLAPLEEIYRALVLGTRDYVTKNGFTDVVIGLSGGIDSSLVAVVAVDALGPDRVHGVAMPSRYSSEASATDALALGARLGIDVATIPIEPAHAALLEMLEPALGDRPPNLTEENIQSRVRGVVLMALSNEKGWMVLTTGNKSESAVGYSTLYGDTAGGFAVIKDVPKGMVYALSRHRNAKAGDDLISEAVLAKAPSAELRPEQRDDQSLPPYAVLDALLAAYVEQDRTGAELEAAGFDPVLVRRVIGLVDRAEYKRRQTPPGVRVSAKAFGKDRRVPISSRYPG